jgi:hemolysin activation/secretion protein
MSKMPGLRTLALVVGLAAGLPGPPLHAAATPEAERFGVLEYRVLGNSVLEGVAIEEKLYPHLGEARTLADVETARKSLEELYHQRGYATVFVDIPDQTVDEGIVRLKVTEGRLDRVRISGARYFANGTIRTAAPEARAGTVPNLPVLQRQLVQVNRQSRDREVTPVLRAGRVPGTVDLELKVKDGLPLHLGLELNDRYTAYTSRYRSNLTASYENLFQRFHTLSFQYQTAPEEPQQVRVLAATYLAPLGLDGDALAFYAVDTQSDLATVVDVNPLAIRGNGRIYGARLIRSLPAAGAWWQSFTLGADYKDFTDTIEISALDPLSGEIDLTRDLTPIRYLNGSLAWAGGWRSASRSLGSSSTLNFGVDGLINDQAEFRYKRARGRASYVYLRSDLQFEQRLWGGSALTLRVAGQAAPAPLISNEQFSIGGAESVRGYLESAQLGDLGAAGTLEWRSPSMHRWLGEWARTATVFVFADGGVVSVLAVPEQNTRYITVRHELYSAGAGLRLAAFGNLEANLDWAWPLRDSGEVEAGDARLHFRTRWSF